VKRIFWLAFIYITSTNVAASEVTLDLSVIGNNQKLVLSIKTNFPPKTILMASLANPVNQGGDGYFGQAKASVSDNQIAEFGPFSKNGATLSPGTYQVTITNVMSALQPKETQSFFGKNGDSLSGQHVSTLAGTSERIVTQTFRLKINPDGSINNTSFKNNSLSDEHTIGSADDVWQKFESGGKEIYVKTNSFFYDKKHYSGTGFHTYLVANLPESNIVGAPQSVMNDLEGNCETRTFHVLGTLFFAGKDRSGVAMKAMPAENIERKLVPKSAFEKAFDMLCKIARSRER